MIIGAPREIKDQEFRVSLTPSGVSALRREGHTALIESGAGEGSGFSDQAYRKAGARVLSSKRSLFEEAELIIKVKEPLPPEYKLFHSGQILFTFLHLAAERRLLDALLKKKVTAIAYETIESEEGARPLLKPMSEVAGKMSVLIGAYYLQKMWGGHGTLLAGVPGVPRGKVMVIGGGVVGKNAAQVALALGAAVTIVEESSPRRAYLDDFFRGQVETLPPYREEIAERLVRNDLVIGAAAHSADRAPHLITRKMVSTMEKGSVVVDVSIDQGGCLETSRPTSHSDPIYTTEGVLHYCVPNIPGVVPRTSTFALTNETLPYLLKLAKLGLKRATRTDPMLARGVNTHQGRVVHPGVAKAFGIKAESLLD
ncbi:MAG TPA: alanine dehydrogenase [Candidatus Manganitrophaceae bacterium]|nr:alanine dehydrogenase [Candidatus Manganitrophaceae bacterium]